MRAHRLAQFYNKNSTGDLIERAYDRSRWQLNKPLSKRNVAISFYKDCNVRDLRTDPLTDVASGMFNPEAAMCVRNVDALTVLQFALVIAFGRVLHRPASRVIRRS